jgi:FO synthase
MPKCYFCQFDVLLCQEIGEEKVPFPFGILIGIGKTWEERLESLIALRTLHAKYGHIQELIIQNFRGKKGTRMEHGEEPPLEELEWTTAIARLTFGPSMSIQAPPNLTFNKYNLVISCAH